MQLRKFIEGKQQQKDMNLLVGQRIQHLFLVDGEVVWFEGSVLQMNSRTKEFTV